MWLLEIVSPFIFATETDSVLRNLIFITVYIKLSSKTFDPFYATGSFYTPWNENIGKPLMVSVALNEF